jgi:hypothetical protein
MMKKVWLILLAVVLVFGLALLGCGSKSSGTNEPDPDDPDGPKVVFTLDLTDNFEYGDGYQGLIDGIIKKVNNKVADIGKITEGKDYTIRVSFTASREFEGDLQVGIADRDSSVSYWKPLTSFDKGGNTDPDSIIATKEEINAATADEPVKKIMTFTAIATAGGTGDNRNSLAFQTTGEGNKGSAGSGVKGKVTLSFYDFAFIEGDAEDLPDEPDPGVPGEPELTFDTATDVIKALTKDSGADIAIDTETGIISRAISTGWGSWVSIAIPEGLTIIPSDTIVVKYIGIGDAAIIVKKPNSTNDLSPSTEVTLKGDDTVRTFEIPAVRYEGVTPGFVSFQGRPNTAAWKFKVISITIEHGDPIKITEPVAAIKPVATETPKTTVTTLQYTGTVSWAPTVADVFAEATAYTATIALTAKTGYTFSGIAADSFPVSGASSVTHVVGTASLSITAVFPDTKGPAADKIVKFVDGDVKGNPTLTGASATVITVDNDSQYSVESYGQYDKSYTYFTVTFDEDVVLSDYAKVSFTVQVVSGAITYKNVYVFAYGIDDTLPSDLPKTDSKYLIAKKEGGNPIGGVGSHNQDLTLVLDDALQDESNSILFAILVMSDNSNKAEYKISNVKFSN